jgi:hypothetical protein
VRRALSRSVRAGLRSTCCCLLVLIVCHMQHTSELLGALGAVQRPGGCSPLQDRASIAACRCVSSVTYSGSVSSVASSHVSLHTVTGCVHRVEMWLLHGVHPAHICVAGRAGPCNVM